MKKTIRLTEHKLRHLIKEVLDDTMSSNNDAAFSQEIQSRLDNGENPYNIFDDVGNFKNGFAEVGIEGKGWNFIDTNGEYLSPNQWFDGVGYFHDGFAAVQNYEKGWNFIDTNGKLLSPNQWFDKLLHVFYDGFAKVGINSKWCKIDTEGNITIDESKQRSAVRITESQLRGMIKQTIREVLNRR